MLVPRCPNCSFALVLLERRLRYKCAKCSRLFSQREIENKTFRIWNKKQKEIDRHNLKLERKAKPKGRPKLPIEEKKRRIQAREEKYKPKRRKKYRLNIGYSRRIKRIQYYRDRQKLLAL